MPGRVERGMSWPVVVLAAALGSFVLPEQAFSAWTVGAPIVTYYAGPGWQLPQTDAIAQQMAEGGWNLAWASTIAELNTVHRHGLRAMWRGSLDNATITQIRTHPALYAYYLMDEPSAAQFADLGATVARLRALDPDRMSYINLFPNYASDAQLGTNGYQEYLSQYMSTVKPSLLSYDHYQFRVGGDTPDYFKNLAIISHTAKQAGIPFLNIVQAASWDPVVRVPTGNEMRYLSYTTLAYGAQGISHYVYYAPNHDGGIVLADGTPTELYTALQPINPRFAAIAEQLHSLESIGAYHLGDLPWGWGTTDGSSPMRLPVDSPFHLSPDVPDTTYVNGQPVKGMLLGLFGPGNQPADATDALVVNLNYTNSVTTTVIGPENLLVFDATTGEWSPTLSNQATLNLLPGGGTLVRLDPVYRWRHDPLVKGNWAAVTNWARGVPNAESEAHVDNGGTARISSAGQTCANLYLGYDAGDEGRAELLVNGSLSTGTTNVGWGGTGTFLQQGGSHVVGAELVVAGQSGSQGTYEMTGGTLSVGRMAVGAAGQGEMTQSGGTITGGAAAVLAVGDQPGGNGTYLLYGTGKVFVSKLQVGNGGTGLFTQAGPSSLVVAEEISLGRLADSSGTHNIGGGALAANVLYIGWEGFGQLNQVGGTIGAVVVIVGTLEGSIGVCDISGGTFMAEHMSVGSITPGALTISGASAEITISTGLSFGSGASFSAVPGATIHMTGSSFDNRSTRARSLAGLANLRLIFEGEGETDSFEAAGRDLGATLAGFDENFTLGTLQLGSEDGVGRVRLVDAFDNQPAWAGSEALYVIELVMGAGAAVDLNGLNLYYLNGGAPKQFLLGDANLDGTVDDVDLTTVASHWQQSGGFAEGDFNGDGFVDDLDLTILALAWPGSPGAPGDTSAVPEPATPAMMVFAGLGLLRRRGERIA